MRVCKDVWGIACNSLQLLVRLIQQSTPWQDFVALGLVDDFARILKMLFSRQNMPGLVLRLISNRSVAFKGDAPSDELLAASDSEQSSEGSNAVVSAAEPSAKGFTADDLVGRLLYESALRHDSASKRRSSSDFFSIGALAKLWTAYIDNLLRLPVTVILNASSNKILEGSAPLALFVGGSGSGGSGISVAGADSGTAGGIRGSLPDIRVNLRDWLCDKSSIPFDMLLPLLDVKEQLSKPNALWAALETVFPIDQLVWAINGVERSSISQACMSAALVMPDISASRPRASAIESVIKNIFLLASQHIVAASGGDDGAGSRYSTVLLYLVWRQLPVFLQKIDLCAAQLEHAVVCLAKQLGAFDLAELAAFGLEDGLLLVPPSPKSNTASLLFLNGDDRDIAQPLVATSMALLVEHSPVFAAMLTGEFSEAQTVQNQKQAQLTLQSSHSILVGLFDVFHRLALLLHPTPDAQWESEVPDLLSALAMSVRQKYSLEDQAAILDMAVYYELRPVSVFLIWSIIKQTASQTASGAAVSVGVLEVLAAMLSEEWGPYFGGDEVSVCLVQRSLAALLLLHLDKLDFASTIGASTDVFLDCLSFIFKS
ncbi:hypothetical protein LPJ75_004216 [Coemansia sp. RSA 2598]|nr:hypothetical protein LPJ75_004216 [Coemansia sp. RSA 2598]